MWDNYTNLVTELSLTLNFLLLNGGNSGVQLLKGAFFCLLQAHDQKKSSFFKLNSDLHLTKMI